MKPHSFYFVQNPVRLNSSVQSPGLHCLRSALLCGTLPRLVLLRGPLLLWMSILELEGGQKQSLVGWLVGRLEVVPAVCQKPAWWMQVVPIHRSDVGGGLKEDRNSDSYHWPSSPPCVWSSHGWLCLLRTIAEGEQSLTYVGKTHLVILSQYPYLAPCLLHSFISLFDFIPFFSSRTIKAGIPQTFSLCSSLMNPTL